jgi:ABC-type glycerol-3-phosphate transport system substrate-binding protein
LGLSLAVLPLSACQPKQPAQGSASGEAALDMHGYEFIIGSHYAGYSDLQRGSYRMADLYLDKYEEIERLYNCKISFRAYPSDGTIASEVHTSIMAGDKPFDILDAPLKTFYSLLASKDLYAQNTIAALDLASPNMNQQITKAGTWNGNVYGSKYTYTDNIPGIFYNKDVLEAKGIEDPGEIYKRGEWTFTKLKEQLTVATGATDSGSRTYGMVISNAISEFFLYAGGGGKVLDKGDNNWIFGLDDPRSMAVVQYLRDLRKQKVFHPESMWDKVSKAFAEGEAAFFPYYIWSAASTFSKLDINYGFVPFPKMDGTEQGAPYVQDCRMFMMPKNLPNPEYTGLIYNKLAELGPDSRSDQIDYYKSIGADDNTIRFFKEMSDQFKLVPGGGAQTVDADLAYYGAWQTSTKEPASEFAAVKSKTQANLDEFKNLITK